MNTLKIMIAGCREYTNYEEAAAYLDEQILPYIAGRTVTVLSGACRGADLLGERYAREHGWAIEQFPADWNRYGKSAGIRRNQTMIDAADVVVCFWDGASRGTKFNVEYTKKLGKPLYVKHITP